MRTKKSRDYWINRLVPLFLICIAVAFLILTPASNKVNVPTKTSASIPNNAAEHKTVKFNDTLLHDIATNLVNTYFNGSDNDKSEQIQALENTLTHLNGMPAGIALPIVSELQKNHIQASINQLQILANQQKNDREAAKTWINIGNIQNLTSAQQALQAYIKATELDPENSNAWNRQGHLYRRLKQFDEAQIAYGRVQQLNSQSLLNQAISQANFGLLNQSKGDFVAAENAFLKSLEIYSGLKNDAGIASTSENLAGLYKNHKKPEKSEKYYLQALKIHQKRNNVQQSETIHAALGSFYQSQQQPEKAQQHYEAALKISLDNNFQSEIANLYNNLGILAQQNNQLDASKHYYEKSLEINHQIKRTLGTADQYANLAILNRAKKNYVLAEDFHKKAIEIYTQHKHENGITSQQINLGFLYKAWKKPEMACKTWKKSLKLLTLKNNSRAEKIKQLINNTCRHE